MDGMDVSSSFDSGVAVATTTVLVLALVAVVCLAVGAVATKQNVALAPLASGRVPIVGHLFAILKHAPRAHDWLNDYCDQHGRKPFRLQVLGGINVTMMTTPELFEDVLKTQFECFDKGPKMCENLQSLLGNGIFAVDGAKWMHQRKTASNLFTMRTLRDSMAHTVHDLMPSMHRILQRAAASEQPIDLVKLLNRFTMEAFAKIGFGIELNCLEAEQEHPFMAAFDSAQRMTTLRFILPRFVWKLQRLLNIGGEADLKKQIKVIDDTVLSIITRSLATRHRGSMNGSPAKDIVSLFLDDVSVDDKHGDNPFDPVFLRDIVVNFLIAGRDTTAQALSWLFYELNQNPEFETRLRRELKLALPDLFEPYALPPSMEQVHKLTYVEAALRETLRLHPSVPTNFKTASHDTVLVDGTFIAKNAAVCISPYSLGRSTHVWGSDAKQFRPERWIDPQQPHKLIAVSAFQFPSFHAGPRMCLGMNLAMMEMKILVASVLSKFELEVVPGQEITYDLSLTLPMKGEFLTRVKAL